MFQLHFQLFGIATEDGTFQWRRWFPDLGVYKDGSHLLFQLRDLTHPPEPPITVLIGPGRVSYEPLYGIGIWIAIGIGSLTNVGNLQPEG